MAAFRGTRGLTPVIVENPIADSSTDPQESLGALFRDLRTSDSGLSERDAQRRLVVDGPNELPHTFRRRWPGEPIKQVTHPLPLVLLVAAVLAWWRGNAVLAVTIVAVIGLNADFAFVQEMQAERAVKALAAYLPTHARRCGQRSARPPGTNLCVPQPVGRARCCMTA